MATTVYEVLELELQNGDEVTVRPLDLKRLRKVMKIIDEMNVRQSEALLAQTKKAEAEASGEDVSETQEEEYDNLEYLIKATKVCLEKQLPDLVKSNSAFEEALDLPTIWKILEVGAGISMGNPNLQREAAGLPGLL